MKLSKRETEIIVLVANGLSDKEIAKMLKISIKTVQTHTRRIYLKMKARNRVHAVTKFFLKNIAFQTPFANLS